MGALTIYPFGSGDPIDRLERVALRGQRQLQYLRTYLAQLDATSILEEPTYIDRDYLSEFSSFYATSVRSHSNRCARLHFFEGDPVTDADFDRALGGHAETLEDLQRRYLGFSVIRPLPHAPLGKTVVRWFPDDRSPRRVATPDRPYVCHIAGLRFEVDGLAWQQQDLGVSRCATIALWSMFHASAFDERHTVPTTAEITRAAGDYAKARTFPSPGLTLQQLLQAIKACGLAPVLMPGDQENLGTRTFSRRRFSTSCASLIRSGYPVLIVGKLGDRHHAVCAVGQRQRSATTEPQAELSFEDASMGFVYVHDDNIGPRARFRVDEAHDQVELVRDAPALSHGFTEPSNGYPRLVPQYLIAAVHEDLRVHPDSLHREALRVGKGIALMLASQTAPAVSARFMLLREFLGAELRRMLATPEALTRTRRALVETVAPMSLHLGLARYGHRGQPLFDVLFDTTETDSFLHAFCTICYHPEAKRLAEASARNGVKNLGTIIGAY